MKHFTTGRTALALLATGVLFLSLAPVASAGGGNSANAKLCQKGGWANLYDADTGLHFTSQNDCITDGRAGDISSLTVQASVDCRGTCFASYSFSGFGLMPGSFVSLFFNLGSTVVGQVVLPDGTAQAPNVVLVDCGLGASAYATATTSRGATITTPAVNSPCG